MKCISFISILLAFKFKSTSSFSPLPPAIRKCIFPTLEIRENLHKAKAYTLNTAFEWLADDREREDSKYSCLQWIDQKSGLASSSSKDEIHMPLYPIGAVYLPSNTTHYLINIEPRNIQMAIDLTRITPIADRKFCIVLMAMDTGQISSVGTVMVIDDMEIKYQPQPSIDSLTSTVQSIRIICRPEAIVNILRILNPEAASWESRIQKSPNYLKAAVQHRFESPPLDKQQQNQLSSMIQELLMSYHTVRRLYLRGIGTQNWHPLAIQALENPNVMPEWKEDALIEERKFWQTLEQWQTLCNTIREVQQVILSADRNELMVATAMAANAKQGGRKILNLPLHEEDMPPEVRRVLQQMEVKAQESFTELRMDPCLDFQVIMSLPNYIDRLRFFLNMVQREQIRLEKIEKEERENKILKVNYPNPNPRPPRKGAWFEE
jgi:hypothetical protein